MKATVVHDDSSRWRTALRFWGLACILGVLVVIRVLVYQGAGSPATTFDLVYGFAVPAAYLLPGVILLLRRRWHIVGWLLCLFAVSMGFVFSSGSGIWSSQDAWIVWLLDSAEGSLAWLPMVALLVVFPEGPAAQAHRQRRVGRVVLIVAGAAAVTELFVAQVSFSGMSGELLPSPLPIAFMPRAVVDNVTISIEFVALAVAFGGLVMRYRSAHATARAQYRWVLSAIVLLVVALLIGLVGSELAGDDDGSWWYPILVAYLFVPISFMVAILRYRLYEIDRLLSRTVTYSIVVAVLAGIYVVAIGVLTQVLPSDSSVAVAASTLTVAAVFRPLLRRVRSAVDRRFNRTRFDTERELERFARRQRDQTDLQAVESELSAVVSRTVQPATVQLWTRR